MFSFFKKDTKKSPVVSPSAEKQEDHTQKNSDSFVIVNDPNINPVYPQFNPSASPLNPATASPTPHPFNRQVRK